MQVFLQVLFSTYLFSYDMFEVKIRVSHALNILQIQKIPWIGWIYWNFIEKLCSRAGPNTNSYIPYL